MAKKSRSHSESIKERVEFCHSKGEEMRKKDNLEMAIRYLNKAKELNNDLGDRFMKAMILESLSFCDRQSGKYEEAINKAEESIAIFKKVPGEIGQRGRGNGLAHLGSIMCVLGKYDEGLRYFEEGIEILSKTKGEPLLGIAYGNMGELLKKRGQFKRGIDLCQKAVVFSRKTKDKYEEARNLHNIGDAYYGLGEFEKSIRYCEESFRIFEEIGSEKGMAISSGVLGNNYKSLGETSVAIRYFEYCIKIKRKLNDFTDLAIAYGNLALVHKLIVFRKLLKLDNKGVKESSEQCIHFFKLAIESTDKILADLKDDSNLTAFSDRFYRWYNCLSTPFILSGRSKAALLSLDLGRAKILRQLVYKQLSDQEDNDGKSTWESSWTTIENNKEDERIRSLIREVKMSESNATLLFYNFNDAGILTIWVLDANGCVHLKSSDPTANYSTMQEELEDRIAKLLEKVSFRLPRGYSFWKPSTALNSDTRQPNRRKTGKGTRQYGTEGDMKKSKHEVRAPAKVGQAEKSSIDLTKDLRLSLYRALIDPVESLIKGTKLIIVPERCIFFAPFSCFVDESGCLLSDKYQIQIIPSVHVLSSSMRRVRRKPIGRSLFVGNPKVDHVGLQPLPSAEEEVKYLASRLNAKPLIGDIATKSKVMDHMSDSSIIHFAAHGEEGTGHIFLALEPNKQSADSLLTQRDVLECKLSARLVVLSCCCSGHGKISSEGVLGIARSFLGAGASSVLVTLWKINDKFTKEFMEVFYEKICEERSACLALKGTINKFQKRKSKIQKFQYQCYCLSVRTYFSWLKELQTLIKVLSLLIRFSRIS